MISWNPFSDRITTARFNSNYIKTAVVQVNIPTNEASNEEKASFYNQLQKVFHEIRCLVKWESWDRMHQWGRGLIMVITLL